MTRYDEADAGHPAETTLKATLDGQPAVLSCLTRGSHTKKIEHVHLKSTDQGVPPPSETRSHTCY